MTTGPSSAFVAGVQSFTAAVSAACNDPADAVAALSQMATFDTTAVLGVTAIPAAMEAVREATAAVCRRAALAALARACAAYQPSSYNDAEALLTQVAALMQAEVLIAADAGDRRSYLAFKQLRAAVIADLTARGALLPALTTVTRARALPALVLAQQLYGDATRCAQLVAEANAPAPWFMPTEFQALQS